MRLRRKHEEEEAVLEKEIEEIKKLLDSKRSFDDNFVWCYTHGRRHRIHEEKDVIYLGSRCQTVKIPKQCLTKYDHIYRHWKFRKEVVKNETKIFSINKCIICGKTIESYVCSN